jgi:hypothetical protein
MILDEDDGVAISNVSIGGAGIVESWEMIGTGCPSIVGPGERGEDSREMVRMSVALAELCLDVEFFR